MNYNTSQIECSPSFDQDCSFLKRKDPKKMTMTELDEYISKNKSQIVHSSINNNQSIKPGIISQESSMIFPELNINQQKENYTQNEAFITNSMIDNNMLSVSPIYAQTDLEIRVKELEKENAELKRNFNQLTELIQKERKDFQNKLVQTISDNEKKFMEDNKKLIKQIDELKIKDSINQTNLNLLKSEKERHIEQNAVDKEYYEEKIKNLKNENLELKDEIKNKVSNINQILKEQEDGIVSEFEQQIKNLKEILNRSEKEKKDIIKKYENKLKELQVKLNKVMRDAEKSRSKSKGKYTNNKINTTFSNITYTQRNTKLSSKSKSKGKKTKSLSLNVSNTSISNDVSNLLAKVDDKINSDNTPSNNNSLGAINDAIFNLERIIADLNHNYKQINDKMNVSSSQEEISLLNRNLLLVGQTIEQQNSYLNDLKAKQQEVLKNGLINNNA